MQSSQSWGLKQEVSRPNLRSRLERHNFELKLQTVVIVSNRMKFELHSLPASRRNDFTLKWNVEITEIIPQTVNRNTKLIKPQHKHTVPDTARKSSMVVMSSTASVRTLTWWIQASLKTSMFSLATLLRGLAARVRAAFITWKEHFRNWWWNASDCKLERVLSLIWCGLYLRG